MSSSDLFKILNHLPKCRFCHKTQLDYNQCIQGRTSHVLEDLSEVVNQALESLISNLIVIRQERDKLNLVCEDYHRHLSHFLLVKLLKQSNCELMIPRETQYSSKYFITTLLEVFKPFNHTLEVQLGGIRLKYCFRNPFLNSKRCRKFIGGDPNHDQKQTYDFLEFYTSITPTDLITTVVYKQADDLRVKSFNQTQLPAEDDESSGLLETYHDYSALYFRFNQISSCKAIFDHQSSHCYLSGTPDEIRKMIEALNQLPIFSSPTQSAFDLSLAEFVSFEGAMEIKTRAILVKPILEQILTIPPLRENWFPKNVNSVAGNYVFVQPGEVAISNEFTDYVSLQIKPHRQHTISDKIWHLSFKGSKQSQMIPFLSMTIALLQMLENVIYDKRFDAYRKAEQDYIHFFQEKQKKISTNASSEAIGSMLQYGLTKREIYTSSLRAIGLSKELIGRYEDRFRPFPLQLSALTTDEIKLEKWKIFYASIISSINPLFERTHSERAHSDQLVVNEFTHPDLASNQAFKQAFDEIHLLVNQATHEARFFFGESENAFGLSFMIGLVSYLFLTYPEKGNVYRLERMKQRNQPALSDMTLEGIDRLELESLPVRSSFFVNRNESHVERSLSLNTQRKRCLGQELCEIIKQLTNAIPEKITFYNPQGQKSFKEFITETFAPDVLRTLLAQHLWDHTKEEMLEKLDKPNVYLQQDLLQNLLNAMIFCFVIDPVTKQYVFQMPRHNNWYAISSEYTNASFLFQTRKGDYEIVLFRGEFPITPMDEKMRSYIKQKLLSQSPDYRPLKYSDIYENLGLKETLEGQLFNADGKCIGFRIKSVESGVERIMDLRVKPQAPIMASHNSGVKAPHAKKLIYVTDSRTNVEEKFGKFKTDNRFELIPTRRTGVQFRVSELHDQSRRWKHRVYLFCRLVISHWLLYRRTNTTTITAYLEQFIKPSDRSRAVQSNPIESAIIPEVHHSVQEFETYLLQVYPNCFYDSVFHVVEEELSSVRSFIQRELEIIKDYPPAFETGFLSSRIDSKLLPSTSHNNELIGRQSILDSIKSTQVKELLQSNSYYMYLSRFDGNVDPVSITFKITQEDQSNPMPELVSHSVKKAELVLIEFRNRLFFVRLTKVGRFETACYIAQKWHRERKIMRYEETTTATTSARRFTHRNGEIIENSDNNQKEIETTGQDYWILSYMRFELPWSIRRPNSTITPVAKVAYAALLPL